MKKKIILLAVILLFAGIAAGCSEDTDESKTIEQTPTVTKAIESTEEIEQPTENLFTIFYSDETVSGHMFEINEMDSFIEDDIWYVNFEDFSDIIGEFHAEDDVLIYENDMVTIKMSTEVSYLFYDGSKAQIDINRIDKDDNIFIPIEKIFNNICSCEYKPEENCMDAYLLYDISEMLLMDADEFTPPGFTINYTDEDGATSEYKIDEMDSYIEDSTWYVNYLDLGSSLGDFSSDGLGCDFYNGYAQILFWEGNTLIKYFDAGEEILRVTDLDIKYKDDNIYISIEKMMMVIGEYEYSDHGTVMNVTQIADIKTLDMWLENQERVSGEDGGGDEGSDEGSGENDYNPFDIFKNLANIKAGFDNESIAIDEVLTVFGATQEHAFITNKSRDEVTAELYMAGHLLESYIVEPHSGRQIDLPWDGTEYEIICKIDNEYTNSSLSFITELNEEAAYERGLFFTADEANNPNGDNSFRQMKNTIANADDLVVKSVKMHGVDVVFMYTESSMEYTDEIIEQFYYNLQMGFHRVWTLYQGFPATSYEYVFTPVSYLCPPDTNYERAAGTIFTTDILSWHGVHPYIYTFSASEAWMPCTIFADKSDDVIWIYKSFCEWMSNVTSLSQTRILETLYEESVIAHNDLGMIEAYKAFNRTHDESYLRYLYVKPELMVQIIVSEYVKYTDNPPEQFIADLYTMYLLENENFDKENVHTMPVYVSLDEFKTGLSELTGNKDLIDGLFDDYIYNGDAYRNLDKSILDLEYLPQFYPYYENEQEQLDNYYSILDEMIAYHDLDKYFK